MRDATIHMLYAYIRYTLKLEIISGSGGRVAIAVSQDDTKGCASCSFVADRFAPYFEHLHSPNKMHAGIFGALFENFAGFEKRMG